MGKLLLGRWLVFDHQWSRNGPDPAMWQEIVQEACDCQQVPVAFITLPRQDVTVVINSAKAPTFEEVRESVDAILHHRFTGEPVRAVDDREGRIGEIDLAPRLLLAGDH